MENPVHASQQEPGNTCDDHQFNEIHDSDARGRGDVLRHESEQHGRNAEPHDRNPISPDHRRTPLQLSEHVGTVDMVSSDAVLQADSRDGLRERVGSRLKENKDG